MGMKHFDGGESFVAIRRCATIVTYEFGGCLFVGAGQHWAAKFPKVRAVLGMLHANFGGVFVLIKAMRWLLLETECSFFKCTLFR